MMMRSFPNMPQILSLDVSRDRKSLWNTRVWCILHPIVGFGMKNVWLRLRRNDMRRGDVNNLFF